MPFRGAAIDIHAQRAYARWMSQQAIAGVAVWAHTGRGPHLSEDQRRVAGLRNPWHGWGASFHLDGYRYPGGNRSGAAFSYNNYEGGFHPTAFWVLSDRSPR